MSYDARSITVLEGLEAVRKRPGMYIGSTSARGLHHLVQEVVDNAVDEALAGFCDRIDVTLLADGGVRVADNGRGIPVDEHPVEKRPAVEVVLTTLHAGGKFDGKSYAVSGGLHGVGVSVVNALSARLEVEIRRDGYVWRQTYELSQPVTPLVRGEETDETGTIISFWPDSSIFTETTDWNFETLSRRLQEMAFLNRSLAINLTDERPDQGNGEPRSVSYRYDGGIADFVRYLNATKEPVHASVIDFGEEGDGISAEIAMQWNASYAESVHTFANTINTAEGGTHEEGFRAALTSIVNRYAKEQKLLREKDDNLVGEDIREGLAAIVHVKLAEPQFEGQTKTKLGNTEARSFVLKVCNDHLRDWFERNPGEAKDIITKATQAARARIAARQARDLTRRKGLLESVVAAREAGRLPVGRPGAVRDLRGRGRFGGRLGQAGPGLGVPGHPAAPRQDPERREGQDRPGAEEQRGPGDDHRAGHRHPRRLRHHQAPLLQDRPDGRRGRGRPAHHHAAAHPAVPVHEAADRGRRMCTWPSRPSTRSSGRGGVGSSLTTPTPTGNATPSIEAGIANGRKDPRPRDGIQRYKGLGEMNAAELWETTMNPANRVLRQVTVDDAAQADELFSVLMGEDVEARRSFIQRNAKDVRFLDI